MLFSRGRSRIEKYMLNKANTETNKQTDRWTKKQHNHRVHTCFLSGGTWVRGQGWPRGRSRPGWPHPPPWSGSKETSVSLGLHHSWDGGQRKRMNDMRARQYFVMEMVLNKLLWAFDHLLHGSFFHICSTAKFCFIVFIVCWICGINEMELEWIRSLATKRPTLPDSDKRKQVTNHQNLKKWCF